jgi:prepilin-type N-terminal cleavage/methylation domain-containing protein
MGRQVYYRFAFGGSGRGAGAGFVYDTDFNKKNTCAHPNIFPLDRGNVMFKKMKAFTLIELLIVVAIIAILAAIAVPNFMEAQTRSKVSRAFSDMRSLKTALESYRIDNNRYIPDRGEDEWQTWRLLTTPVSYISSVLITPFPAKDAGGADSSGFYPYDYGGGTATGDWTGISSEYPVGQEYGQFYIMLCYGPNRKIDFDWRAGDDLTATPPKAATDVVNLALLNAEGLNLLYDATNGTMSAGDIIATNKTMNNK